MKSTKPLFLLLSIFFLTCIAGETFAQGFMNLDFEAANPSGYSPGGGIPTSAAIPGWAAYYGTTTGTNQSSEIGYDFISLGGEMISLQDRNATSSPLDFSVLPIQRNYSVLLQGPQPGLETSVAIGQTGTIPVGTQSLTFFGVLGGSVLGGSLQVTFNGQNISYGAIGTGANYTIYGANIASYAGQNGELLFTTPVQTVGLLDNIQFSSSPVPEPSELALLALGGLAYAWRYRQKFLRT